MKAGTVERPLEISKDNPITESDVGRWVLRRNGMLNCITRFHSKDRYSAKTDNSEDSGAAVTPDGKHYDDEEHAMDAVRFATPAEVCEHYTVRELIDVINQRIDGGTPFADWLDPNDLDA